MVAALIVLLVLGIGLPVVLWVISRWRLSRPETLGGYERRGEIDQWLISEYHLSHGDRDRVRRAVLGRWDVRQAALEPVPAERDPLPSALLEPARGLAAGVLAGQFRTLRVSRWPGLLLLGLAAAYAAFGIFAIAGERGGDPTMGVYALIYCGLAGVSTVFITVLTPRGRRRGAERVLQLPDPERPRSGELPGPLGGVSPR
jgi:hypothetical protein